MATTPNYGWVTPAPTDLVTDLPADFETFADAVDADLAGLLGGTTGQVLKKTSGTDHDFAFGVDPTFDLVTTAGDLVYGTAADTMARLGIGTANQVLTVNSGATAPEWKTPAAGGGMTLINTGGTTLSGATTTISSIPGTYKNLQIIVVNPLAATDATYLRFRINGASSGYKSQVLTETTGTFNEDSLYFGDNADNATSDGVAWINIYDYANTSIWKSVDMWGYVNNATTSANWGARGGKAVYNGLSAVTSLVFSPLSGNWTSGTVYVYGVS